MGSLIICQNPGCGKIALFLSTRGYYPTSPSKDAQQGDAASLQRIILCTQCLQESNEGQIIAKIGHRPLFKLSPDITAKLEAAGARGTPPVARRLAMAAPPGQGRPPAGCPPDPDLWQSSRQMLQGKIHSFLSTGSNNYSITDTMRKADELAERIIAQLRTLPDPRTFKNRLREIAIRFDVKSESIGCGGYLLNVNYYSSQMLTTLLLLPSVFASTHPWPSAVAPKYREALDKLFHDLLSVEDFVARPDEDLMNAKEREDARLERERVDRTRTVNKELFDPRRETQSDGNNMIMNDRSIIGSLSNAKRTRSSFSGSDEDPDGEVTRPGAEDWGGGGGHYDSFDEDGGAGPSHALLGRKEASMATLGGMIGPAHKGSGSGSGPGSEFTFGNKPAHSVETTTMVGGTARPPLMAPSSAAAASVSQHNRFGFLSLGHQPAAPPPAAPPPARTMMGRGQITPPASPQGASRMHHGPFASVLGPSPRAFEETVPPSQPRDPRPPASGRANYKPRPDVLRPTQPAAQAPVAPATGPVRPPPSQKQRVPCRPQMSDERLSDGAGPSAPLARPPNAPLPAAASAPPFSHRPLNLSGPLGRVDDDEIEVVEHHPAPQVAPQAPDTLPAEDSERTVTAAELGAGPTPRDQTKSTAQSPLQAAVVAGPSAEPQRPHQQQAQTPVRPPPAVLPQRQQSEPQPAQPSVGVGVPIFKRKRSRADLWDEDDPDALQGYFEFEDDSPIRTPLRSNRKRPGGVGADDADDATNAKIAQILNEDVMMQLAQDMDHSRDSESTDDMQDDTYRPGARARGGKSPAGGKKPKGGAKLKKTPTPPTDPAKQSGKKPAKKSVKGGKPPLDHVDGGEEDRGGPSLPPQAALRAVRVAIPIAGRDPGTPPNPSASDITDLPHFIEAGREGDLDNEGQVTSAGAGTTGTLAAAEVMANLNRPGVGTRDNMLLSIPLRPGVLWERISRSGPGDLGAGWQLRLLDDDFMDWGLGPDTRPEDIFKYRPAAQR